MAKKVRGLSLGPISYVWGSVYSDLKSSAKGYARDTFNEARENNPKFNKVVESVSNKWTGFKKGTKNVYKSAVAELKDLTATMMALDDLSNHVSPNKDPMEVFNGLVDQNRQALDNANGISPIFRGIATGLNYATEGIASPTKELIDDILIVAAGVQIGKLTYQQGRKFIFREIPKKCPNPGNNLFKKFNQEVDFPSKNLYNKRTSSTKHPQTVRDTRIDPLTSNANHKFFDSVRVHEILPAESANRALMQWYEKPPFLLGTKATKFEANGKMEFVRMYTKGKTNLAGRFVTLYEDIKGLTAQQLKDRFDLPHLPTHLSIVKPPKGTEMMNGLVKEGNFGGSGMGTQFYFTDKVKESWFKKFKKIGE